MSRGYTSRLRKAMAAAPPDPSAARADLDPLSRAVLGLGAEAAAVALGLTDRRAAAIYGAASADSGEVCVPVWVASVGAG